MSKKVNQTSDEATNPSTVETEGYVDPEMLILQALEGPDTPRPTLEDDVEDDESVDLDDPAEEVEGEEPEDEDDPSGNHEEIDDDEDYLLDDDEDQEDTDDETDLDVTSDEDEDESEEENEWYYVGHHSEYRTQAEAFKGIEVKDAYIIDLESTNDELKNDVATLREKLSVYSNTISEEAIEAAAIQSTLPEEFRGKTEDDFEDDEQLRAFWKANLVAEERFKARQAENKEKARKEEEARAEASKNAGKFVRDNATASFFGIRNPEERHQLRQVLTSKDDKGWTPVDRARMIVEVFGESDGLRYLEGLRLEIQGEGEPVSTTKSKDTKSKKKVAADKKRMPPKKVVQRIKKTSVKKKVKVTPPPKDKPRDKYANVDTLTMIADGLK